VEKVNGQHDRHDATDALVRLRETPAGQDMECIEAFVVIKKESCSNRCKYYKVGLSLDSHATAKLW